MECAFPAPVSIAPPLDEQQARPLAAPAACGQPETVCAIGGKHIVHLPRNQPRKDRMPARRGRRRDVGRQGNQRSRQDIGDDQVIGRAVPDRRMVGPRRDRKRKPPAATPHAIAPPTSPYQSPV